MAEKVFFNFHDKDVIIDGKKDNVAYRCFKSS